MLVPELTANVDVSGLGTHSETNHESALHKLVRVVAKDLAVLASAGLGLVSVDHQVRWSVTVKFKLAHFDVQLLS